nr:MAG TPA: hypothetical protein [Bacteriophage sp.]
MNIFYLRIKFSKERLSKVSFSSFFKNIIKLFNLSIIFISLNNIITRNHYTSRSWVFTFNRFRIYIRDKSRDHLSI